MSESSPEADRDPDALSPHTKFPWAPALLCAACLAMAAWTWMRYSYCWGISARDLPSLAEANVDLDVPASMMIYEPAIPLPVGPDLLEPVWPEAYSDHWLRERYVRVKGRVEFTSSMSEYIGNDGAVSKIDDKTIWVTDGTGSVRVLVPSAREAPYREGKDATLRGRLTTDDWWWWADLSVKSMSSFALDISVGRWHPASVAGLVVGAMGVFVFALYLRSWVRERRASVTPQ